MYGTTNQRQDRMRSLVVILVAECPAADDGAAHGVHDVANGDVGEDVAHVDDLAHAERVSVVVVAVDAGGAHGRVGLLPAVEAVVDEGVVHPEDRVAGAG